MSKQFKRLFEPIMIGPMEVKNRIALAPMRTGYASDTGAVTKRLINYYSEVAKGGAGMVIIEGTNVDRHVGLVGPIPCILTDSDIFIAGLYDLAEGIHRYGAKAVLQFQHAGFSAVTEPGRQPVSPSATQVRPGLNAHALTIEEIKDVQESFAEAARRGKAAGFDAVEINGGGGILLNQFLSSLTNKRTDKYGGDLEERMRFVLELIERVQQKVGKDYPIFFDLQTDEFIKGGVTLAESNILAQRLEKLGVAAFRMHSGPLDLKYWPQMFPPSGSPQGFQVHYAEQTKKVLRRAKVMVGRQIQDPDYANRVLEEGKADIILLGRPLFADHEVPKKWAEGRLDDVRKCLYCNGCITCYFKEQAIRCTVNAALGREHEYRIIPASKPKRVMVVGGGPGGMEAARVAALRGHRVSLYEQSARLGGQMNLACIPPCKGEVKDLVTYLSTQINKLGVKVKLNTKVTKKLIGEEKPDVVILATGAKPLVPDIAGVDNKIVTTAWDILRGKQAGEKIVVIGGGRVGLETAEFLAEKGKKVTVIEQLPEVGADVELSAKILQNERLAKLVVKTFASMKPERITDRGVEAVNANGQRQTFEADTVVLAAGAVSNRPLEGLKRAGAEVYSIGDCVAPRNLMEAVHEGYWISTRI